MSSFPATTLISELFNLITTDTPFLALYTTNPGVDNTGTEVTGGTYARQSITFGSVVSNHISNSAGITFSGMPTTTAPYYGILDASSGGNLLVYGAIPDPIVATAGDNVILNIGDILLNFSGS